MTLRIVLLSFIFGINLCGAYSQTVKLSRIERAAGADYTVVTNADGKQEYILVDSLGVVAGDDWGTQVVEIAFGLLGMGVAGDALEVDTSDIATLYALQDSAASIRADFPVNTDAQNLTIGGSGPAYTVDISGGSDVTIEAAGIAALSEPSANVLRITATEVDGSVTNEIQTVDTLVLTGTTLGVSLSQDGVPQKTVDLSALQDGTGTDNQTLAIVADDGPGGDSLNLSISGGNWVRFFFLNTGAFGIFADQDGDDVLISVTEGDADPTNELQNLTIGGSGPSYTVDISSGSDVTIEAAGIATLSEPSANVLRITATEVDGSVTNELQNLTIGGSGPSYTVDISSGTDVTVEAAGIATLSEPSANVLRITATEVDGSVTNELQDLTIGGSGPTYTIDLSDGDDVTISAAGNVSLSEPTANTLRITGATHFASIRLNGEVYLTGSAEADIPWTVSAVEIDEGDIYAVADSSYIRVEFDGFVEVGFSSTMVADSAAYTSMTSIRLYTNNTYEATMLFEGPFSLDEAKAGAATYIMPVTAGDKLRLRYQNLSSTRIDATFPHFYVRRL